jgi:hypothetical protein
MRSSDPSIANHGSCATFSPRCTALVTEG